MPITEGPSTSTQKRIGVEEEGEEEEGGYEVEDREEEDGMTSPSVSLPVRTETRTEPRSPKSAKVEETPRSSVPVEGDSGPSREEASRGLSGTHGDFGPIRVAASGSHSETQSALPWQRLTVSEEKSDTIRETMEEAVEDTGVSWEIVITVVAASLSSVFLVFTVSLEMGMKVADKHSGKNPPS